MIIGDKKQDVEIVGVDTSKKATISQDKMAKLQYLLTKGLYKDPQTAVIAEWTNNAVDSMVQAGKDPIENPVIVSLDKSKNDVNQWIFSVEDKGTGLDDRDFEDICMNYLESTKDTSNELIGSFGIGMKSFLALERPAMFRCRKNGKERLYMVYEGEEFVNYDLISCVDTTEENGVRAELTLNNWIEHDSFSRKITAKLAYYDTVVIMMDGMIIQNNIHRNDLFQWSSQSTDDNMHLCLKDVYYPIDWSALGIRQINIPIALRFSLGDGITPTPSRESYITTETSKNLILNRIREVAKWFVEKYNSENKREYDTLLEAYDKIDYTQYFVALNGTSFKINELLSYSSEKIPEIKIKGISINSPSFYKGHMDNLFYEWTPVGYQSYNGGTWTVKVKYKTTIFRQLQDKLKPVLLSVSPVGNIKAFLREKYQGETLFITRNNRRWLGSHRNNHQFTSYSYVLSLRSKNKGEWRPIIKEWQFVRDSLASNFIDETNVANSPEYLAWLQNKKDMLKARRNSPEYKALAKQKGDVTIAYSYRCRNGISFKKAVYKIASLYSNKYLTVMISPEDDLGRAKDMIGRIPYNKGINFALVGKKEIKKIPNHYQFITLNQFIMDSKPFKRLASAILFESTIDDFEQLREGKEELFTKCLTKLDEDYTRLKEYAKRNHKYTGDNEVKDYILQVAKDNDLFDKEIWDVYLRVKEGIKKYDFITCFNEPSYLDEENKKKYNRTIAQMLLFRKKYYNDLPENVEIEIKVIPDAVAEEKEGDEEEGEFDVDGEITENDLVEEETI